MNEITMITGANDLRDKGRQLTAPLKLYLENDELLHCETVLRLLPGKRVVCQAFWKDHRVVAKIFFAKGRARKHFIRELSIYESLAQRNILQPQMLYSGYANARGVYVLLYAYIKNPIELSDLWEDLNESQQIKLLGDLVGVVANCHEEGYAQSDCHFGNFMISQDDASKVYTLDPAGFNQYPKVGGISLKDGVANLALLLSQKPLDYELRHKLLSQYSKLRNFNLSPNLKCLFHDKVASYKSSREKSFLSKIYRDCTAYTKVSFGQYSGMCSSNVYEQNLKSFCKSPNEVFARLSASLISVKNNIRSGGNSASAVLKNGGSSTVIRADFSGGDYVIKRYNIKSALHLLKRCLRKTRADMNWRHAHQMKFRGLPIVMPLAFVQRCLFGFLKQESYVVMPYVDGVRCDHFFADVKFKDEWINVSKMIIELLNLLDQQNVYHGDLKASNILIVDGCPFLIDFDGVKVCDSSLQFKKYKGLDRKRFIKNWDNSPQIKSLFKGQNI